MDYKRFQIVPAAACTTVWDRSGWGACGRSLVSYKIKKICIDPYVFEKYNS